MSQGLASARLRVSAISYLNTVPLMYDFHASATQERLASDYEIHYTLPFRCAEELRDGASDIGIVPVAAYTTIPDLQIIPEVAIAAKNPVRSILLISQRDPEDVRSVAADTSSRTSVALLHVLFERRYKTKPEFVPEPPDLEAMLSRHDAALLIGDPALKVDVSDGRFLYFDLAQEWQTLTGLPFVFAFWAVRGGAAAAALAASAPKVFQRSRDTGLRNLDELVSRCETSYGMSAESIRQYLSFHIDYSLDEPNIEGLKTFFHYASECGSLPEAPALRFLSR